MGFFGDGRVADLHVFRREHQFNATSALTEDALPLGVVDHDQRGGVAGAYGERFVGTQVENLPWRHDPCKLLDAVGVDLHPGALGCFDGQRDAASVEILLELRQGGGGDGTGREGGKGGCPGLGGLRDDITRQR